MRKCCLISAGRKAGRAAPMPIGEAMGSDDGVVALRRPGSPSLRGGRRGGGLSNDRGLQRRTAGGLRSLAGDDPRRKAVQRCNWLSAAGTNAPRISNRHRSAGDPHSARWQPCGRRRISQARRAHYRRGRTRGDPGGRRNQLAAIADALRHRPPEMLQAHGIGVAAPLPGVGRNLQDHISAGILWRRSEPGPLHAKMRLDRIARELAKTYFFGTGITNNLPGGVMAFLKSDETAQLPDVQLLFAAAPMVAQPYLPPFTAPYRDSFGCRAVVLRPESRGRLELASVDPRRPLRIRQNFLATDKDWKTLRAGLRMVREIAHHAPLRAFIEGELAPGPEARSDEALDAHIRSTGITVHHPLGTCRMGPAHDAMAVVDPELRVLGIDGLRVADASVMPDLVGGNINAPVIMVAEKAADLIRGRAPVGPINV